MTLLVSGEDRVNPDVCVCGKELVCRVGFRWTPAPERVSSPGWFGEAVPDFSQLLYF